MGKASAKSPTEERCTFSSLILNSPLQQTNKMLIQTVFDIHTKQPAYAICNSQHRCGYVTYSITKAISAAQCENFNQVQELVSK